MLSYMRVCERRREGEGEERRGRGKKKYTKVVRSASQMRMVRWFTNKRIQPWRPSL